MTTDEDYTLSSVLRTMDELPPEESLEKIAVIFLRGYSAADGRTKYLSNEMERRFRGALAKLLRGTTPLSRNVRDAFADLIAVDDEWPWPRKIRFGFRREGNRSDPAFESDVAAVVEEHLMRGYKVEDGIQAAVETFGLDERVVKRYWGRRTKAIDFKMQPGRRPRKKHT